MDVVMRDATIFLGGKPLANARVRLGERRGPLVFGDVGSQPAPPPTTFTYNFTATCNGSDATKAFAALRPVETPAVRLTVPWGILGNISVRGWIDSSTLAQNEHGATATLGMIADEKSLRRAVSMTVEKAIATPNGREDVALRVKRQDGPALFQMAEKILGKWAGDRGCYHGERKARKAMRRLLRAAGVTRST